MGVVTTIEINSPLNLIRSIVVGNVFPLKTHFETTIKIKPQLKKNSSWGCISFEKSLRNHY